MVPRPPSATSARAESPAVPEPEASEDGPHAESSQDAQRASLRIRLRPPAPRKWYGEDDKEPYSSQGPKSRASLGPSALKAASRPSLQGTEQSATPSGSQPGSGDAAKDVPQRTEDGAQSKRGRQTRLKIKPLSAAG